MFTIHAQSAYGSFTERAQAPKWQKGEVDVIMHFEIPCHLSINLPFLGRDVNKRDKVQYKKKCHFAFTPL